LSNLSQNNKTAQVGYTLAEIAAEIDGVVHGDEQHQVQHVATLKNADQSCVSFLSNTKYRKFLADTHAGCVLVLEKDLDAVPTNAIVVADSYVAYAKVATLLNPDNQFSQSIHATAVVAEDAHIDSTAHIGAHVVIGSNVSIASNVVIEPGCVIENDVMLGEHTHLRPNVTICKQVRIGNRVKIHPGVVIGADGFGIANDKGKWIKIPQLGSVVIGDDVEIGANTTIDRGALDDTVIGNGVKLDNQIQIGHNDVIGDHTVIAGCVGISGSTTIGSHCAIGGGTGIAGHITIADGVQLTGMSMVTKSITTAGTYSSGIPVEPTQQWHKNVVRYRKMADLFQRVKKLESL
jgi:UDP-3-O-[3-hydroxymyristoyl] glucosamine N-acyltransferase